LKSHAQTQPSGKIANESSSGSLHFQEGASSHFCIRGARLLPLAVINMPFGNKTSGENSDV